MMTEHDDLQYAKTLITMITIATMTMMTMINIVRMAWFCQQIQSAVETTDQNQGTLKWIRLSLANKMQTSKQKQQFFHSPLLSSYPSSFAQLPPLTSFTKLSSTSLARRFLRLSSKSSWRTWSISWLGTVAEVGFQKLETIRPRRILRGRMVWIGFYHENPWDWYCSGLWAVRHVKHHMSKTKVIVQQHVQSLQRSRYL